MSDKVAYRVHIKITVSPLSSPQKLPIKMQINHYKMTANKNNNIPIRKLSSSCQELSSCVFLLTSPRFSFDMFCLVLYIPSIHSVCLFMK